MSLPGIIAITVPGKPQGKGRPRFARANGRAYTPAKTVTYEGMIATFGLEAMRGYTPWPKGTALRCEVAAIFDVPASWSKRKQQAALVNAIRPTGKPDGDNLLKCIGDALNAIVWHDDSAVVEWSVTKRYGEVARLQIEVMEA